MTPEGMFLMQEQSIICACGCGQQLEPSKTGSDYPKRFNYLHFPKPKSVDQRFWDKVQKTGSCWLWTAASDKHGYGRFNFDHQLVLAHHWLVGVPFKGYEWDHRCRVPACVNPDHLELVTHQVNMSRGLGGVLKTHCKQGHPWIPENIYTRSSGSRYCMVCHREYDARKRRKV